MPSALTTLPRVRAALPPGAVADDAELAVLLDAASAALAAYCRRELALGAWTEIRGGRGRETVRLRRYPVRSVERVAAATRTALLVRHADDGAAARTTPTGLTVLRPGHAAATFTFTAFPTLQALAAGIVAAGNGWTAAALEPFLAWPAADLQPARAPQPAGGAGAEFRVFDAVLAARLDPDAGLLAGEFPRGADNIRIEYTAGYEPVPEDLQLACAALAAHWFAERQRDPTLFRERLGDETATRWPPRDWPELARALAAPYRAVA